jgi:hypothetical protein
MADLSLALLAFRRWLRLHVCPEPERQVWISC